ncbi:OmpA family protein [Rhodospirillaceae bacterium SYSU D60014]|uniref:OmpA family protein n=1 Tax=Virgifigura deserti TaxID=2268457 RepID=UPI000E66AB01
MLLSDSLGPLARAVPLIAMIALSACATSGPNPAVQRAQSSYNAATQDPAVVEHATSELDQARALLSRAEAAQEEGEEDEAAHRAYLASQQVAVAEETAAFSQTREAILTADQTARTQQLEQELAALRAEQTSRGLVVTLSNFLFRTDSAELAPGAQSTIDQLATFLNDHPEQKVRIEGYTDSTGSDAYNLALSEQRAEAVRTALVIHGVDPSRIETQGLGEISPVAVNSTSQGRQMNRRVEVVILNAG